MYSFEFIDNTLIKNNKKSKGVKISVDSKNDEYKQLLFNEEIIYKEFYNLQLNKQNMYLKKLMK